jgi:hypothetical protein
MALTDKKLPLDLKPDDRIAAEIRRRLDAAGMISCAMAMQIAVHMGVAPEAVGQNLDALGIHLTRCQIGLFGYPGHAKGWAQAGTADLPEPIGLIDDLNGVVDPAGTLSCVGIWEAAERFGISRLQAGLAADRTGRKIIGCQLGAF